MCVLLSWVEWWRPIQGVSPSVPWISSGLTTTLTRKTTYVAAWQHTYVITLTLNSYMVFLPKEHFIFWEVFVHHSVQTLGTAVGSNQTEICLKCLIQDQVWHLQPCQAQSHIIRRYITFFFLDHILMFGVNFWCEALDLLDFC